MEFIFNQHNMSWCCINYFNSIFRAHEHRGFHITARYPIEDFQALTGKNNLIHLPIKGVSNIWSNRRKR